MSLKQRRWFWPAVAAVAALALAGGVFAVVVTVTHENRTMRVSEYGASVASAESNRSALETTIKEAHTLLDSISDPGELSDPKLVDSLTSLLLRAEKRAEKSTDVLEGSAIEAASDSELAASTKAVSTQAKEDKSLSRDLSALTDDVRASRDTKETDVARADLGTAIAEGEAIYLSTQGRVDDESVRLALRAELDRSQAALDKKEAIAVLRQATTLVNDAAAAADAAIRFVWSDLNGKWCAAKDCTTISSLRDDFGFEFVDSNKMDQASPGCHRGELVPGAGVDGGGANVAYCPPGEPYWIADPSKGCNITEDISRERLYVFQGCSDPYYRQ